jgi:RHS repeat-associated protein
VNNNSRAFFPSRLVLLFCLITSSLLVPKPTNAANMAAPLPAPLQLPKEPGLTGWDENSIGVATEPTRRRGRNPVYDTVGIKRSALQDDAGVYSDNFHFSVPIVHLAGRGLDVNLDLHYNSRVWEQMGRQMKFDPDGDWPAVGWSLGFGKIVNDILVEADGTRHLANMKVTTIGSGLHVDAHTTDGSFIDYVILYPTTDRHHASRAEAKYPDGTTVTFGAGGADGKTLYPLQITDANGNRIQISYLKGQGPAINTITDTLGRTIQFHYEAYRNSSGEERVRPVAIVGPGLQGGTRTLIRLHYFDVQEVKRRINHQFADGIIGPPKLEPQLIDAIVIPGLQEGYWFGDDDSYSSYGMLRKVSERRKMTLDVASLTQQGTVTNSGQVTYERTYEYPLGPEPLSQVPTYRTVREWWEGMDTEPAVTQYRVTDSRIETIYPDHSSSVQTSSPAGLVESVVIRDALGTVLQENRYTWEAGEASATRLRRIQIHEPGTREPRATEYSYGTRNQVVEVRDFDYGLRLLRRTVIEYETNPVYESRHIFNLVKAVEIFDGSSNVSVARTEYRYDESQLSQTPDVVSHVALFDPERASGISQCVKWEKKDCGAPQGETGPTPQGPPCTRHCTEFKWLSDYDTKNIHYRGNLTSITRYVNPSTRSGPITEHRRYDLTGNLVAVSIAPGEETVFGYTAATQYAYPEVVTRGATDPASSIRLRTRTTYDFNTGLVLATTDANGRTTQFSYSPDTLRLQQITRPTGAFTIYQYNVESDPSVFEFVHDSSGQLTAHQRQHLNGLGLVRMWKQQVTEGAFNTIETKYDVMGRVWLQSPPYHDQPLPEAQWTKFEYDALGRVITTTLPDGSVTSLHYNEPLEEHPSNNVAIVPGQTVRSVDAWGRERWTRSNALGWVIQVAMPDPQTGSIGEGGEIATKYSYNALGQVTQIEQEPQPQIRRFRYDGLGRLTHQYLPEKQATLTDAGEYNQSSGQWSDLFSYDDRSNLIAHTDARGIKTLYDYGNDPLGRLQAIRYDLSGFGDTANLVLAAPSVIYEYMQDGDLTRLFTIATEGIGVKQYEYDIEGFQTSSVFTFRDHPGRRFLAGNLPDSLGRTIIINYPEAGQFVQYDYTLGGQIQQVLGNVGLYASDLVYNPAGQMTAVKIGPANPLQLTEIYNYDPLTSLLTAQQVTRAGSALLNLGYEYRQFSTSYEDSTLPDHNEECIPGSCEIYMGCNARPCEPIFEYKPGITGQLTQRIDHLNRAGNQSYTYDGWGRLRTLAGGYPMSTSSYDWQQEYTYDPYGNRTDVRAFDPSWESDLICAFTGECPELLAEWHDGLGDLTYDTNTNHITSLGFAYDATGNLTRAVRTDGRAQIYQYDAAGRLAQVRDEAGNVLESYTYAGASNYRIITQYGAPSSGRKYYVWSGDHVIAEYDAPDASTPTTLQWSKSYIYLGERLLATVEQSGIGELVRYYHPDRLSTILISTADNMTVTKQATFAYGVEIPGNPASSNSMRFTTYDRSQSTGLDYAVNRYYDPQQGRFIRVDPLGKEAVDLANPLSLNLYSYVEGDPANATDPLGLAENTYGSDCGNYAGDRWVLGGCYSEALGGFFQSPYVNPPPGFGGYSPGVGNSSADFGSYGGAGGGSDNCTQLKAGEGASFDPAQEPSLYETDMQLRKRAELINELVGSVVPTQVSPGGLKPWFVPKSSLGTLAFIRRFHKLFSPFNSALNEKLRNDAVIQQDIQQAQQAGPLEETMADYMKLQQVFNSIGLYFPWQTLPTSNFQQGGCNFK